MRVEGEFGGVTSQSQSPYCGYQSTEHPPAYQGVQQRQRDDGYQHLVVNTILLYWVAMKTLYHINVFQKRAGC